MLPAASTTGRRLSTAVLLAVVVCGCGSATQLLRSGSSRTQSTAALGVPAATVAVIKGWSSALRQGHVTAAARYFGIPSIFFGGTAPPMRLRSLAQVEAVNASLPCGARFLSAHRRGRYINALFRLTDRSGPGGEQGCGAGTGQTARTDFLIHAGHILQWLRAPDEPGDNGSPRTSPSPNAPGTTPGGAPPVA